MKLRLSCPEGFGYAGYQKVIVSNVGPIPGTFPMHPTESLASWLKRTWNGMLIETQPDVDEGFMYCDGDHIFVESGESFTLADFAEGVHGALEIAIEFKDGDDKEWSQC